MSEILFQIFLNPIVCSLFKSQIDFKSIAGILEAILIAI